MILKTKELQEAANKIRAAMGSDKQNTTNLEIVAKAQTLFLNVTNREFYVSVRFPLNQEEDFRAVVKAEQFLTLISDITADEITLGTKDTTITIKAGRGSFKLPMIYENKDLMQLPIIAIENKTLEMTIKNDILQSILNVNSREIQKGKGVNINELQKLYYVDEEGCFTFTTGACLNSFTLEKPVKLLLNDRIVQLFKLFKDDVQFSLGQDKLLDNRIRTKISLETADTYVAAIINCDDLLLSKIQGPCTATKRFISEAYAHSIVLSVTELRNTVKLLKNLTKTTVDNANMFRIPTAVHIDNESFQMTDASGNTVSVPVENGSFVADSYDMTINLADIESVLESCKVETITLNCGNHRSVVIARGGVHNLIPEMGQNK